MAVGKNTRRTPLEKAGDFDKLAGKIDFAAIQKQEPQVQAMILQQKQQELMQAQEANQSQVAQLQQQLDQGAENGLSEKELDEIKSEVENALKAGQKLSHEIQNVQEAQMEAQNAASQEHSFRNRQTPRPGGGMS